MKKRKLNDPEKRVIIDKGTEPVFSGRYEDFFEEEGFTPKNIRHCVNSISIDFTCEKE